MKRLIYILVITSLISCTKDIEKYNENVVDPANIPGEALFTSAQKSLVDQMMSTSVNNNIFRLINQHWTETTYTDESNYDLVTRTIPEQHWEFLYKDVLKDLKESAIKIESAPITPTFDPIVQKNKLEIIEILNVYTYSVLVETFGDVPYSQALDLKFRTPKYDDGLTIYKDLLVRLDIAINLLDPSAGSFGENDRIYFGDVSKWQKFAHSLKLKMGLVLADIPSEVSLAQATVSSAAPLVFNSNSDNASMTYLTASPNTNPLYTDLVASGRSDFVAANTLIDYMSSLNDPRISKFFDNNLTDPVTNEVIYDGGIYGSENAFGDYTHITKTIQVPNYPGTILDLSEVEFLLAEAAERSFYGTPADAEQHYNNAITASILFWGGTLDEANNYIAQPNINYVTASGTWREKIGNQSWIALYNNGFEGWTSWRRFDFPLLVAPPDAVSEIPVRFTYPIIEQTLNGDSYQAASAAIGGDLVETKLFWDIF